MRNCAHEYVCWAMVEYGDAECPGLCDAYAPMVDVDALRAMADEIWENADLSRELHREMLEEKRLDMALTFHEHACELREYAERIREALGVDE